ncbi:undecaprenyldiphospho-muramoylpentapeptide beta-N-acetylglucosaminyltransferase [Candidatus Steffania adelgidicola]|uniref:undecaprenyldiphospho-muramoylpentapeptide beta-N-acetylglucosaminyltransferase n=1 Tax=Candidatus Steffania adelgidicola TaxID=1076626 RepID=UPI001D01A95A|nr:undecaprenyldiphospho-muramoylpentapeptide beta-N-acetylglucosaminyltransferase [Candidatus Steffania adelgidicola]UDG80137.1 UDP-N-acetylglucosamine--N-acetylmuramyl-(pentapeptide) pyrophosphoryl-undecaprenol N-acetylglucosamine transferase [Candidatus Steffania adelgidicola]
MVQKTRRLIVMAGGTGGHVFPGLSVAEYLITQGWQVRWLGTIDRIEADLVPQHGIDIDYIRIGSLRGKGLKSQLKASLRILPAIYQARKIMCSWQPDVVLGMGGYVSGPGGLAAWSCGIPLVLHEQNGIAGLTNRLLAKIAQKVLQAFPGAFPNAAVVGNPVRDAISSLPPPEIRFQYRTGPLRVLVLGGSQGAHVLNQVMPVVAARLPNQLTLWHQVGKDELAEASQGYALIRETQYKTVKFIDDIAAAYAWADVMVCRAGALTVSEIAAAGLAALFVPFPHQDRQQYWNATPLVKVCAAKIIEQTEFTVERVSAVLANWDRSTLLTMAQRARETAIPDATIRVAREVAAAV